MTGERPALEQLPRVASTARVLRLVNWRGGQWDPNAPPGARLQPSNMTAKDCTEIPTTSYGASFWLARDPATNTGVDVADVEAADPKYQSYGVLRILVADAEVHGVYFAHSPHDGARYPAIAHAHVTLVWPNGFDPSLRLKLLESFEKDVIREPSPPTP
jgi:hypothetical protein